MAMRTAGVRDVAPPLAAYHLGQLAQTAVGQVPGAALQHVAAPAGFAAVWFALAPSQGAERMKVSRETTMRVIYTRLLITGMLLAAMWALTASGPNLEASPSGGVPGTVGR